MGAILLISCVSKLLILYGHSGVDDRLGSKAESADPETGRYKTYAVTLRNDRGIDDYQP